MAREIRIPYPTISISLELLFCIPSCSLAKYIGYWTLKIEFGGPYKGNPHMDKLIMKEPMTKSTRWTHHIRILLRRHALAVLLGEFGAITALRGLAARRATAVRRRAVFVWLGNHFGFVVAELVGEGFARWESGGMAVGERPEWEGVGCGCEAW